MKVLCVGRFLLEQAFQKFWNKLAKGSLHGKNSCSLDLLESYIVLLVTSNCGFNFNAALSNNQIGKRLQVQRESGNSYDAFFIIRCDYSTDRN